MCTSDFYRLCQNKEELETVKNIVTTQDWETLDLNG